MRREELTAEASTQLIAGSDTTSNSSCLITYHLVRNPRVQRKLQAELDTALDPPPLPSPSSFPLNTQTKRQRRSTDRPDIRNPNVRTD